jgi:uncharacterized Zn-finger protein
VQFKNRQTKTANMASAMSDISEDEFEQEEGNEDDGEGIQQCDFPGCKKEFKSRWSLTRHVRTHTGERPFKCTLCPKEFLQKCSLKRHEQTHAESKQWICDHQGCGKRFKLKEYLDVHKRTHLKGDADSHHVEFLDNDVEDSAETSGALM